MCVCLCVCVCRVVLESLPNMERPGARTDKLSGQTSLYSKKKSGEVLTGIPSSL